MVDLNDHKCMFEYTDEELLEQGKLDIQVRSHGIRDDRTFQNNIQSWKKSASDGFENMKI